MKVGLQLLFQGRPDVDDRLVYQHELEMALAAEDRGFDMVLPVEHHFFDYAMCPDNSQFLSYVAARTKTIKLMPAAFILPWNDPLRVVEKTILLDHLSGGRAMLGLGRGLAKSEFDGFRVNFSESRGRFDDAAQMIVRALETGVAQNDGPFYKQPRVEIRPRFLKTFADRRYMVGMSPQSVETAAQLGLGCLKFSNAPWASALEEINSYYRAFEAAHHRPAPRLMAADMLVCLPDVNKARQTALECMSMYFTQVLSHYELLSDNFAKAGDAYKSYAARTQFLREANKQDLVEGYLEANLWGTPEMIVKKLEERRRVIGDFDLSVAVNFGHIPFATAKESFENFAQHVLPRLQGNKN